MISISLIELNLMVLVLIAGFLAGILLAYGIMRKVLTGWKKTQRYAKELEEKLKQREQRGFIFTSHPLS